MDLLGRQPLFKLLAAIIVLMITDAKPLWGLVAAAIWVAWVYISYVVSPQPFGLNFGNLQ
jgi:hypothetical protein